MTTYRSLAATQRWILLLALALAGPLLADDRSMNEPTSGYTPAWPERRSLPLLAILAIVTALGVTWLISDRRTVEQQGQGRHASRQRPDGVFQKSHRDGSD